MKSDQNEKTSKKNNSTSLETPNIPRLILLAFGSFLFVYAFIESQEFSGTAGHFPTWVSLIGIILALSVVIPEVARGCKWLRKTKIRTPKKIEMIQSARYYATPWLWLTGFLIMIWGLGVMPASGLFVAAFLWFEARIRSLFWIIFSSVVTMSLLYYFGELMNMEWPNSLL